MDKGAGFATRSPQTRRPNKSLGIITSPNLQGSAGSLCVRSGRGGNLCPAHQNRHISPGRLTGSCPIGHARRADIENERRNCESARPSRRYIRVLGRQLEVDRPPGLPARTPPVVRGASGARNTKLQTAACQRHYRLPPMTAGPPPLGPIPRSHTSQRLRLCCAVVDCNQSCTRISTSSQQKCFGIRGSLPTESGIWDWAGSAMSESPLQVGTK